MRTKDGRIKVLDFGLARVETGPGGIAATLTAALPGGIVGTPAYMSPEQIEGRTAGPAADVFSFGVLMYEWISGRHPFQAASTLATLARVLDSTPDPLTSHAHVPKWLSDIIDRCMRKPVSERFASASELLQAFDHPPIVDETAEPQQYVVADASSRRDRALHNRLGSRVAHQGMVSRSDVALGLRGDWDRRFGRRHHPRPFDFHRRDEPAASDERARADEKAEAVH